MRYLNHCFLILFFVLGLYLWISPTLYTRPLSVEQDLSLPHVADEIVVKVNSSARTKLGSWGTLVPLELEDVYVIKVSDIRTSLSDISSIEGVIWAGPNYLASIFDDVSDHDKTLSDVNDPLRSQQWTLDIVEARSAWDVSRGRGVVIGIVDTGASFGHSDLVGKYPSRGRDFVNNDDDASDDQGHGTHVAGIAAASTNNLNGMASVGYEAQFLMCKGLAATGNGPLSVVSNCVKWLSDQPGVRVINLSLGCACPHPIHAEYVSYATSRNIVVVAAAGNNGDGTTRFYPASESGVVGVGAIDRSLTRAGFSNYGPNIRVVAPGSSILGTVMTGGYEQWNGTSMASPNVSAIAALVIATNPSLSELDVRRRLENTATDLGSVGFDVVYGYGLVNARRSVSGSVSPPPTSTPTRSFPPPPSPRPTFPPSNSFTDEVERLINIERTTRGLLPLRVDARLRGAGRFHNDWMARNNCFSHNCPGEPPVLTRIRNTGYPVISGGEIIAGGYVSPSAAVSGWMNSSGHRATILNTYWPDMGCDYLEAPTSMYRHLWSCEFARGETMLPPTSTPASTPTPLPTRMSSPSPSPTRPSFFTLTPMPSVTPVPPDNGVRLSMITVRGFTLDHIRLELYALSRKWRNSGIIYWTTQSQPAADQHVSIPVYVTSEARDEFALFCSKYSSTTGVLCRRE